MSPFLFRQVCRCLQQGGIIAYPTEAVFGLGCDPDNAQAVFRLLEIKQRPWQKGLILLAANLQQLLPYLSPLSTDVKQKIVSPNKRPTTWLIPAASHTPKWLTGESDLLAVRISQHPLATRLCEAWGKPLVSTSANRAACIAQKTATKVRAQLGKDVNWIVAGKVGQQSRPSEIRDVYTGDIIRS